MPPVITAPASPLSVPHGVPTTADLQKYAVNRPGMTEANTQSLYDFTTYLAAGQSSLSFFQTPNGQSSKTTYDTNMDLAGQLANPKQFLMFSLEIHFFPGVLPGLTGAAALADGFSNDVYTFLKSGWLELYIGSKAYLTEAPLGRFPPKCRMSLDSAVATTVTTQQTSMSYAAAVGRSYSLRAPILLQPTQNFKVTLNWPSLVPLPSGNDARVGVVLDGITYRLSQ